MISKYIGETEKTLVLYLKMLLEAVQFYFLMKGMLFLVKEQK